MLDELNLFIGLPAMMWAIIAIGVAVGSAIIWVVHEMFIMSSFAKEARAMKRKKGLFALIQENNVLRLVHSSGSLPEGLYMLDKKWFVRPQNPYLGDAAPQPKRRGRPSKNQTELEKCDSPISPDQREALNEVLQVPILEGVGKPLFVGCVNQPLLTNISTVAHADLTRIREIIPATLTQTQLDALYTYSKLKGIKQAGKEQMRIIILAIAAALVIGSLGLIVYLLTQHPQAASVLMALI